MPRLVYLHGFLSSPQSKKAQQTKLWLAEYCSSRESSWEYSCPNLSPDPIKAKTAIVEALGKNSEQNYLIGSSLGGFWSTWAIEQGLANKAVLINPAVRPHRRFRLSLGETFEHYYSDETYTVNEGDLLELSHCSYQAVSDPQRYWVLLQKEDEVLDYRFAETYYKGCRMDIEEGGDHSFVGYENYMPAIMQFFKN